MDDPQVTKLRHEIVRSKPLLRRLLADWYGLLSACVPEGSGAVLELGSGAGFLREHVPGLVTSDVIPVPGIDLRLDARLLPFREGALRAVLAVDVLHHVPDCRSFFLEASRAVRPGGVLAFIEPWVSGWSRFIYRAVGHEPFMPDAPDWSFPETGPLSGANMALPWIVFQRDADRFTREFPWWSLERVEPMNPLLYIATGGVGFRSLAPGWVHPVLKGVERALSPLRSSLSMFALVVARRTVVASGVAEEPR